MLRNLMMNGITVAVAIGAMALVGCGQNSSSSNSGNSSTGNGGAAVDTPAPTGQAADASEQASGGSDDAASASLALDESSAQGAINTYVNRLKAGDLVGAAEICVAEAPGTVSLLSIGNSIKKMLANPEDAGNGELATTLFVNDFKTLEASKIIEEDGVVVYEVKVLNKPAVNIRVEQRDGAWRVIPPPDGLPFG